MLELLEILSDLNSMVTLGLSTFVIGAAFCRMRVIEMRVVQYRYAAPIFLAWVFGLFSLWTLIGGDRPDYYMPIALLAISIQMFNNRNDWRQGVPPHMLRERRHPETHMVDRRKPEPRGRPSINKWVKVQNFFVGLGVCVTMGVTATAAIDGQGNPIQIYSVHAEPRIVTPNATIEIVYSLRRTRTCSGYVDRFIIQTDNQQVVQRFASTAIGSAKIGIRLDVRVPIKLDNLPIGNYVYRAIASNYCDDSAKPYVTVVPDVPFIVGPEQVK